MNCEQLRDSYDLFAMGVAEEPERSEIRLHLSRGCEVCMKGMKEAMELTALMANTAVDAQPAPRLRQRILASVGIESRKFGWAPWWALATALSLAAAIFLIYQDRNLATEAQILRHELSLRNTELTRLTEAFSILSGRETREASFGNAQPKPPQGRVFVNPAQGVLLIASNLPPTPSGKLYEMWTIPKGGKPVPAGLFQSRTDGSAMHIRSGSIDIQTTAAVAVTVENETGSDQPTTQPLIVAAFAGATNR